MIIQLGSKGQAVKTVQAALIKQGEKIDADGIFGPKTKGAVERWQVANGYQANGRVDAFQYKKLSGVQVSFMKTDMIGDTPISIDTENGVITFVDGFHVDADGSPRAYGPAGTKPLDYLANAGTPGNWWGIATDKQGVPYIQGKDDPYPGYYVSTTSLTNPGYAVSDPRRYINSETVPFIVLPPAYKNWGVKMGAKCRVTNLTNGKSSEAVFADVGPATKIGEGSIALAEALGIPSNPKKGGTDKKIIRYEVFI